MKAPTSRIYSFEFRVSAMQQNFLHVGEMLLCENLYVTVLKAYSLASVNGSSRFCAWNRRFRYCVVPESVLIKCEGSDCGDCVLPSR